MAKSTIPEVLPVNPISLVCPHCKAKPGKDCITLSGGLAIVHLERIKGAAAMDVAKKKTREDVNQAAARIVREATEKD